MSRKLNPYRPSRPSRGEGLAEVIRGLADLVETRVRLAFRGYVIAMVALSALFLMIGLNIRGWFISRTPVPVNNPAPVKPQQGPRILPDPTIVEPRMDDDGQIKYQIVVPTEQRQIAAPPAISGETGTYGALPRTKPTPEPAVKEFRMDAGVARQGVAPTRGTAPRGNTRKPVPRANVVVSPAGERKSPTVSHGVGDRIVPRIFPTAPRTLISPSAEFSDEVATRPRRLGKKGKEE